MLLLLNLTIEVRTHGLQVNLTDELVSVEVPQRRGDALIITEDEEYKNVRMDKIPTLRPVFEKKELLQLPMLLP